MAEELQLHPSTISLDVQYLKTKAQEELRTHIQERIPFEYQRSRQAINDLIRRANEILDNTKDDPKTQLQVINTLANLLARNMSLTTMDLPLSRLTRRCKLWRKSKDEVARKQSFPRRILHLTRDRRG